MNSIDFIDLHGRAGELRTGEGALQRRMMTHRMSLTDPVMPDDPSST